MSLHVGACFTKYQFLIYTRYNCYVIPTMFPHYSQSCHILKYNPLFPIEKVAAVAHTHFVHLDWVRFTCRILFTTFTSSKRLGSVVFSRRRTPKRGRHARMTKTTTTEPPTAAHSSARPENLTGLFGSNNWRCMHKARLSNDDFSRLVRLQLFKC